MAALFADLPEALASTVEIAQRCAFRPRTRKPILPRFTAQTARAVDEAAELRRQADEGLDAPHRRRSASRRGCTIDDYRERLDFELGVIERMKYPGYFLIVADFIQWAKSQGIPVGPGRGSGAGSLVAYALTITDLDPIRFGLLFERFLNPERVSMPDFDIDFCQDRRDEVIRLRAGALRARSGRADHHLRHAAGARRAARRRPRAGNALRAGRQAVQAGAEESGRAGDARRARSTRSRACRRRATPSRWCGAPSTSRMKLEGLHRHASTHAAGIVIGDRPLAELVPMYRDPKSDLPVTQFNMKWVEQAGLVKFDFLGLKTLTVLQTAVEAGRRGAASSSICSRIPLDDAKSYEMLARGETVGIFQVEGQGMRRALIDMRPDRFEDIIALVALYRPGPMANIPTYCARKHGKEQPEYIHPKLEPVLRETFGVIIYQEQVMEAARRLSGYSLGEADLLRRAMGKKIRSEMEAQRKRFVEGAVERRRREGTGGGDLRAARALCRLRLQQEPRGGLRARRLPDRLHEGELSGRVPRRVDDLRHGEYRQALGIPRRGAAPRRQGRAAVDQPLGRRFRRRGRHDPLRARGAERRRARRRSRRSSRRAATSRSATSRTSPAASIRARSTSACWRASRAAGAFDALESNRARVHAGVDVILAAAQRRHEDADDRAERIVRRRRRRASKFRCRRPQPWLPAERLQREFDAIGFFLSGHPLDDYAAVARSG